MLFNSGWPETHNPPTSASHVLGLQAFATTLGSFAIKKILVFRGFGLLA
jgi:hypothetical protein